MRVPDIFEREAIQKGDKIDNHFFIFGKGAFKDIKIFLSVEAPEDRIYIHPKMLTTLLNNAKEGFLITNE